VGQFGVAIGALASRLGKTKNNSFWNDSLESIGISGFSDFLITRNIHHFLDEMRSIISAWKCGQVEKIVFPADLSANLTLISSQIGLNSVEKSIFGFSVLLHTEPIIRSFAEEFGPVSAVSVARILANILELPLGEVEAALEPTGALAKSGILTIDHIGSGDLHTRIDLLTRSFPNRMVKSQKSITSLLSGFIAQSPQAEFELSKFEHLQANAKILKAHITSSLIKKSRGVNILIYGSPGVGKTQFTRALAASLQIELLEVCVARANKSAMAPSARMRAYMLGQSIYSNTKSLFLFDECEEIFCNDKFVIESDDQSDMPRKSWINALLEGNEVPTIWVCNSIDAFDAAYIRRMDMCINIGNPSKADRKVSFDQSYGEQFSPEFIDQIVQCEHVTPAMMSKTANILESMRDVSSSEQELQTIATDCINQKLKAIGRHALKLSGSSAFDFDPDLINSGLNLRAIATNLTAHKQGRICIYGPAGTGKTAFGSWLAQELDLPHLVFKPSDLLGKFVGESEKRIAHAFSKAQSEGAILQFDEVDSLLCARTAEMKSWEVSLVNEMLTQMEAFEGIFIASTNLFEHLDEAALRRFDLNVKFDFLTQQTACEFFRQLCSKSGFGEASVESERHVCAMGNLTPGDFSQLLRQHRFNPITSQQDAVSRLSSAVGLKRAGRQSIGIGFLKAA